MSFGTDINFVILKCSIKIILGAVGDSQGSTHGATHRMSIWWIGGAFSMHDGKGYGAQRHFQQYLSFI